eukprot:COSAG06_NODE_635_length_13557_cov_10.837581_4_plen_219_part_00
MAQTKRFLYLVARIPEGNRGVVHQPGRWRKNDIRVARSFLELFLCLFVPSLSWQNDKFLYEPRPGPGGAFSHLGSAAPQQRFDGRHRPAPDRAASRTYLLRPKTLVSVKTAGLSAIRVSWKSQQRFRDTPKPSFRPFWLESSRFDVQMGAQNGATTQFESQRHDIYIPRSRYSRGRSGCRVGRTPHRKDRPARCLRPCAKTINQVKNASFASFVPSLS